jgi:hypothetical protein
MDRDAFLYSRFWPPWSGCFVLCVGPLWTDLLFLLDIMMRSSSARSRKKFTFFVNALFPGNYYAINHHPALYVVNRPQSFFLIQWSAVLLRFGGKNHFNRSYITADNVQAGSFNEAVDLRKEEVEQLIVNLILDNVLVCVPCKYCQVNSIVYLCQSLKVDVIDHFILPKSCVAFVCAAAYSFVVPHFSYNHIMGR